MSTFGSLENIYKEKFELAKAVNNGYVVSYIISTNITFDINYGGQTTEYGIVLSDSITIKNPGSPVTLDVPELDKYVG